MRIERKRVDFCYNIFLSAWLTDYMRFFSSSSSSEKWTNKGKKWTFFISFFLLAIILWSKKVKVKSKGQQWAEAVEQSHHGKEKKITWPLFDLALCKWYIHHQPPEKLAFFREHDHEAVKNGYVIFITIISIIIVCALFTWLCTGLWGCATSAAELVCTVLWLFINASCWFM